MEFNSSSAKGKQIGKDCVSNKPDAEIIDSSVRT